MLVPQTSHLDSVLTNFSGFSAGLYLILTSPAWLLLATIRLGSNGAWPAGGHAGRWRWASSAWCNCCSCGNRAARCTFRPCWPCPFSRPFAWAASRMAFATTASVTLLFSGGGCLGPPLDPPAQWVGAGRCSVATVCAGYSVAVAPSHPPPGPAPGLASRAWLAANHRLAHRKKRHLNTLIIDRP